MIEAAIAASLVAIAAVLTAAVVRSFMRDMSDLRAREIGNTADLEEFRHLVESLSQANQETGSQIAALQDLTNNIRHDVQTIFTEGKFRRKRRL